MHTHIKPEMYTFASKLLVKGSKFFSVAVNATTRVTGSNSRRRIYGDRKKLPAILSKMYGYRFLTNDESNKLCII